MIALFNKLLDWFKALFWKEEMELTLVGLQYSGKTTFVNVIAVIKPFLPSLYYRPRSSNGSRDRRRAADYREIGRDSAASGQIRNHQKQCIRSETMCPIQRY